jgi:hypothetical protein
MVSIEWLAGFFDGEGCINITLAGKTRQPSLRVYLVNTDAAILAEVQAQYGGLLTKPRQLNPKWKPFRSIQWRNESGETLLRLLIPHLKIKQRQAQLALEFREYMKTSGRLEGFVNSYGSISHRRKPETIAKELEFKAAMHILNKKGVSMLEVQ